MSPTTTTVLFKNSYGFLLSFVVANMKDASNVRLEIERPDGSKIEHDINEAEINNSTKTVTYLVQAGDLNQTGTYKVRLTDVSPGRNIPAVKRIFRVRDLD